MRRRTRGEARAAEASARLERGRGAEVITTPIAASPSAQPRPRRPRIRRARLAHRATSPSATAPRAARNARRAPRSPRTCRSSRRPARAARRRRDARARRRGAPPPRARLAVSTGPPRRPCSSCAAASPNSTAARTRARAAPASGPRSPPFSRRRRSERRGPRREPSSERAARRRWCPSSRRRTRRRRASRTGSQPVRKPREAVERLLHGPRRARQRGAAAQRRHAFSRLCRPRTRRERERRRGAAPTRQHDRARLVETPRSRLPRAPPNVRTRRAGAARDAADGSSPVQHRRVAAVSAREEARLGRAVLARRSRSGRGGRRSRSAGTRDVRAEALDPLELEARDLDHRDVVRLPDRAIESGVPRLPPTNARRPCRASIAPTSVVVVLLPLVPVTAMIGPSSSAPRARSRSRTGSAPRAPRAAVGVGAARPGSARRDRRRRGAPGRPRAEPTLDARRAAAASARRGRVVGTRHARAAARDTQRAAAARPVRRGRPRGRGRGTVFHHRSFSVREREQRAA